MNENIQNYLTTIAENQQGVRDAGIEQGRKQEYNDFWGLYLRSKSNENFSHRFAGRGWNDETFYPNKDINTGANSANYMFSQSLITNLEERLNSLGITLDVSRATKLDNLFYYCTKTEVIPIIDASGVDVDGSRFTNMFFECSKLHTIRKLIFPQNMTSSSCYSGMFTRCSSLANIEVEGNIVQTISFSSSPLTVKSMKSIIEHLKDFTGTSKENTYTITFKAADDTYTAPTELEAEGATAEYNGQPCTWAELVAYKKWKLG